LSGKFRPAQFRQRVFRHPHHTASGVALVGGSSNPRPGEISLAHHGVLFLDELPEFDRKVLEVLREPLESGHITISRAARQTDFPAQFQLVAAMNPCPCGYLGQARCRCTPDQIIRYQGKISGPLLDRIDMVCEVPALPETDLLAAAQGENSATVAERVAAALALQQARQGKSNARLSNSELESVSVLDSTSTQFLQQAIQKLKLSARAYHRVLKLARTIADLQNTADLNLPHVAEALQYRRGLSVNDF
jgi:magnesium chelatase family protein